MPSFCNIKWNNLTPQDWAARFVKVKRSSILQSYDYARAICPLYQQRARWGLIEMDGAEVGLVQILEAGVFKNALHAVMCDRAPLWFEGFGTLAHFEAFTAALAKEFPRRIGRKRRFIPEMQTGPQVREVLENHGFKPVHDNSYQTIWVDLTQGEDQLFAAIKKKQRHAIRKAEKANMTVEWDDTGQYLPWLLKHYDIDKKHKKYEGAASQVISALAATHIPHKRMLIARALRDDKAIAAILVLCHGGCATYQIGWTSEEGRKAAAHPYLLWEAYKALKAKAVTALDLGGVNDESASGVKTFKESMGGRLEELPGLYT